MIQNPILPGFTLRSAPLRPLPAKDDFDGEQLGNFYYAPRILPQRFADVKARPGWVRLRGQEAPSSLNKVSFLAQKLTGLHVRVSTKMEFHPETPKHDAGLMLYYDNMNYLYLRNYYSESLQHSALLVQRMENGARTQFDRTPVNSDTLYLRLYIRGKVCWLEWSYDGAAYQKIGPEFDTTKFSDEYSQYGEFTGTMVGITCADRLFRRHCADFDFFEYLEGSSGAE